MSTQDFDQEPDDTPTTPTHTPRLAFILLAIFAGGALGATLRIACDLALYAVYPADSFTDVLIVPWSTWFVNILGSFLLGFVYVRFSLKAEGEVSYMLPFLATGLLGAFTTYGAVAVGLARGLLEPAPAFSAVVLFLATTAMLVLGVAAALLGVRLGQGRKNV
ncbi:MAG: CrcB family protein [Actinomycetaceae bacterium]|nr:CrcB family protein [Actinomycetaceae bacterium]